MYLRPRGSTIRCVDAHLVLLVVLLLIAIVVVVIDARRGKVKEEKEQQLPAAVLQPPVEEMVVDEPRVAIVVHGNPVTRLTIRRLLEQQGYDVVEARDHDSALACIAMQTKTARPAIVIVDSDLLEMGSVDLVRSIEADPNCGVIQIVIIAADAEADQVAPEQADGAVQVQYLRKPFSGDTLVAALHSESG